MTEKILWAVNRQITGLNLVPSDGGRFEVSIDGELVYSKIETGEFPDEEELVAKIKERVGVPASS